MGADADRRATGSRPMQDLGLTLFNVVASNPLPAGAVLGSSLLTLLAFVYPRSGLN